MATNFLVLEDGTVLEGESFGYEGEASGEVVFTTGMSGYQEALTDPSCRGELLIFTYPLIGNYGVNDRFEQSDDVHVRGVVAREYCREPSTMYGGAPLDRYLIDHKIPAISGIDTRELVVKIRNNGTLKGAIIFDKKKADAVVKELKGMRDVYDDNLVAEVSAKKTQKIDSGKDVTVGIIDCGATRSFIADISSRANVIVFPYDASADDVIKAGVNGLVISNGPGNPANKEIMDTVGKTVKSLSEKMPIMGVSLGGQIIANAFGAKTYKLKFGHRGANHPVRFENKVYITSQNHAFAIDKDSVKGDLEINEINVNDGSVEAVRHKKLPVFGTEYLADELPHEENRTLFDRFIDEVKEAM